MLHFNKKKKKKNERSAQLTLTMFKDSYWQIIDDD